MSQIAPLEDYTRKLIAQALETAAEQVDDPFDDPDQPRTAYAEALQVERAIENLAELDEHVRQAILQLMWRMERDLLYAELNHTTMLDWALANPRLNQRWSHETIDRYAKAITRILPDVFRSPVITPDGEIWGPEEVLANVSMSALAHYSYTYANTENESDRRQMLVSALRHDGEDTRKGIIQTIRSSRTPLDPITVFSAYAEGRVQFHGECSAEQWSVMTSLLGTFLNERFAQPEAV